jgi:hypothetical protein
VPPPTGLDTVSGRQLRDALHARGRRYSPKRLRVLNALWPGHKTTSAPHRSTNESVPLSRQALTRHLSTAPSSLCKLSDSFTGSVLSDSLSAMP